jgi:hypothetical protein
LLLTSFGGATDAGAPRRREHDAEGGRSVTTASAHVPNEARRRRTLFLAAFLLALAGVAVAVIADAARRDGSNGTSGVVQGSGVAASERRELGAFDTVKLEGANDVRIRIGSPQSVVVHADDNLVGRVLTDVQDRELTIGNRGGFATVVPMRVEITVPALAGGTLTGSGAVAVEGVRGTAFTVAVPGTGSFTASGAVERLHATLGGSGDVDLSGLTAHEVTASVPGTGRLLVHATRSLDASVSGVGSIEYGGNPATVTQHVTGVGAVVERQ